MEPILDKTNGHDEMPARRPSIGICMPGENFSSDWVSNWTNLFMSLLAGGYDPAPLFGYSSSVFVTRSSLALEMIHSSVPIDYVLWIDDDQIVTPEMFRQLKQDLDEHPEADMVAGWSWVEGNAMRGIPPIVSCGRLRPGYTTDPFDWGEMKRAAAAGSLLEAHYTGFPCVLMRHSLLTKAGVNPFAPLLGDEMRWGMTGEDLAFCVHARERGGALILVDPRVKVPHLKTSAIPDPVDQFETVDLAKAPMVRAPRPRRMFCGVPLFSLCHPTLRFPEGWRKACQEWFDLADNPEDCEYILCTEQTVELQRSSVPWKHFKKVSNHGRNTAVSAWNTSAEVSIGKFIITVADDFSPCPHWDTELLKVIPNLDEQWVVEVATGGDDSILTHQMLTRAYYQRYGRLFYPEYWGMFADNDFTDVARRDGVVINARQLMFQHHHPLYGTGQWDKTYNWQNRTASYEHGRQIYDWRKAHNFEDRVKAGWVETRFEQEQPVSAV
jgi:hypothetical protein